MDSKTARVAELNDELRRYLPRGIAVMTPGIAALEAIDRIVKAVAAFNNFCAANDPYQEREFGAFDARWSNDLFQDRILRQNLDLPLTRPLKPFAAKSPLDT